MLLREPDNVSYRRKWLGKFSGPRICTATIHCFSLLVFACITHFTRFARSTCIDCGIPVATPVSFFRWLGRVKRVIDPVIFPMLE
jgi:hypothetical protein